MQRTNFAAFLTLNLENRSVEISSDYNFRSSPATSKSRPGNTDAEWTSRRPSFWANNETLGDFSHDDEDYLS